MEYETFFHLLNTSLFSSGLVAGGVVMLVLAVIMVVAGIITCYYTVKLGNKASAERRQVCFYLSNVLFIHKHSKSRV